MSDSKKLYFDLPGKGYGEYGEMRSRNTKLTWLTFRSAVKEMLTNPVKVPSSMDGWM